MRHRVPEPSRCRAYAAALRAAHPLAGGGPAGVLRSIDVDPNPEIVERYRLLLIAAAVARGGSDGAAVAAVLGRGYVLVPGATARGTLRPGVCPIAAPDAVRFGAGLPRYGSPWWAVVRCAMDIDLARLPPVDVVSAHASLRIRRELRLNGHDLG